MLGSSFWLGLWLGLGLLTAPTAHMLGSSFWLGLGLGLLTPPTAHHVGVIVLVWDGDAAGCMSIAGAAASHHHVIHRVVVLLLDLITRVQKVVTCHRAADRHHTGVRHLPPAEL